MNVVRSLSRFLALVAVAGLAFAIPATHATATQSNVAAQPAASTSKPLAGKVIVLDPGHGGKDTGTQQSYKFCDLPSPNGQRLINEKDITLKIAFKLKADLEAQGATVYMTRETDVFVDLWDRVHMAADVSLTPQGQRDGAASRPGDIFISIHVNSVDYKTDFDEIQVYSYYAPGKLLSQKIAPVLQQEMGKHTRIINPMDFRVVDHNPSIPSILIETGFITKASTCRDLVDDQYQSRMAHAIADGVDNYFGVIQMNLPPVDETDPRHHDADITGQANVQDLIISDPIESHDHLGE